MERVLVTVGLGVDAARVADELRELGAKDAALPTPELPGVLVCEVPKRRVEMFLDAAAGVPGVQVAERDALRFTDPDAAGAGSAPVGSADSDNPDAHERHADPQPDLAPTPPTDGPVIFGD